MVESLGLPVPKPRVLQYTLQVRQLEMERFSMNKAVATDKGAASRMSALDKLLKELKSQQAVRPDPDPMYPSPSPLLSVPAIRAEATVASGDVAGPLCSATPRGVIYNHCHRCSTGGGISAVPSVVR